MPFGYIACKCIYPPAIFVTLTEVFSGRLWIPLGVMFVLMTVRRQFNLLRTVFNIILVLWEAFTHGITCMPNVYVIAFFAFNCVNYSFRFTGGSRFEFQYCSRVLILEGLAGTHLFAKDGVTISTCCGFHSEFIQLRVPRANTNTDCGSLFGKASLSLSSRIIFTSVIAVWRCFSL